MQIPFEVNGHDVMLHWHSTMNKVELEVGDEMIPINTWWHPNQQFTTKRTRTWETHLCGRRITVEKTKPGIGLIGIGRANEIVVRVDGEFVAREIGT